MELDEQVAWLEDQLRTALETIARLAPADSPEAKEASRVYDRIDEVLAS